MRSTHLLPHSLTAHVTCTSLAACPPLDLPSRLTGSNEPSPQHPSGVDRKWWGGGERAQHRIPELWASQKGSTPQAFVQPGMHSSTCSGHTKQAQASGVLGATQVCCTLNELKGSPQGPAGGILTVVPNEGKREDPCTPRRSCQSTHLHI